MFSKSGKDCGGYARRLQRLCVGRYGYKSSFGAKKNRRGFHEVFRQKFVTDVLREFDIHSRYNAFQSHLARPLTLSASAISGLLLLVLLLVPSPTPPIIAVLSVQQGWRIISALDLWKRVTLICIRWLLLLLQVLSFTFHRHHWDKTGNFSRY